MEHFLFVNLKLSKCSSQVILESKSSSLVDNGIDQAVQDPYRQHCPTEAWNSLLFIYLIPIDSHRLFTILSLLDLLQSTK